MTDEGEVEESTAILSKRASKRHNVAFGRKFDLTHSKQNKIFNGKTKEKLLVERESFWCFEREEEQLKKTDFKPGAICIDDLLSCFREEDDLIDLGIEEMFNFDPEKSGNLSDKMKNMIDAISMVDDKESGDALNLFFMDKCLEFRQNEMNLKIAVNNFEILKKIQYSETTTKIS